LGVITTVTLSVEPSYSVKKVSQVVSLEEALSDMQSRASSNGFFEFSWIPHVNKAQLVIINETKEKSSEGKMKIL
jgi:hypothetical protein